ncbi:MAG: Mn2+/Fe2+ NRAMP family transporter [Verrucomicrobiales bacterium]|jgi:Mn2+/Fe2+ NRAMP family transporter
MSDQNDDAQLQAEIAELEAASEKGTAAKLALYTRRSGPGWLQGAITLGGGSLAGALYLGVIMGYHMMWLQPLAMILGVIMLSAISYVTLSTGKRPFQAINTHVSPALGWGWLIATIMANIVWCLPQFALGTGALTQNLFPGMSKVVAAGSILLIAVIVVWFYNSGSNGIKIFEIILKVMVGIVVLCFFGVVVSLTFAGDLEWKEIFAGLVPDFSLLFKPVPSLEPAIAATGTHAGWWSDSIATLQRDKIITAFATAVGINMTFLLPYSMLRKRWGKAHRGLAIYDLSIGLIVPFVLATACVVIAAASQFHADDTPSLSGKSLGSYNSFLDKRLSQEFGDDFKTLQANVKAAGGDEAAATVAKAAVQEKRDLLPDADKALAVMMASRDNQDLALTLEPLTGKEVAQKVFGIGVLGMAVSTVIILMLINGFAFCEAIGKPATGNWHRIGSMIPAIGVVGPFVWVKAAPALATPTSVLGGAMLPIAYMTFLLLMNSRSLLGDAMPRGIKRIIWNVLMIGATLIASFASVWGLWTKNYTTAAGSTIPAGKIGIAILTALLIVGVIGFIRNSGKIDSEQS